MTKPLDLKHVALSDLHISLLNMRHKPKTTKGRSNEPILDDILPSIRERGIRQPLLVRPEPTKDNKNAYGIIAGRRRYFCLQAIVSEGGEVGGVPVCIMNADDDAQAIEASIIENMARLAPTPMEQHTAFDKLSKKGKTIAEIASVFGITTRMVKQRLALGQLIPVLKQAYTDSEIDNETIFALTMATKKQQKDWFDLFSTDEYTPTGEQLKAWLSGGGCITVEKALFPMEDYKGTILTDLFGEHDQFADIEKFWSAQNAAISVQADEYKKDGWRDVFVGDIGRHFPRYDYAQRTKEQGGNVYVQIGDNGDVHFHEGFMPKEEAKRIDAILHKKPDADSNASNRPEMSGPLLEYMSLHRHSIARAHLLKHPKIALRLTVAHMLTSSGNWKVERDYQRTSKESTDLSLTNSRAEQELATERQAICELLEYRCEHFQLYQRYSSPFNIEDVFGRLINMDDNSVMRIMTFCMCETLKNESGAVEAVAVLTGAKFEEYWVPDDGFFDLLRDKSVLNLMVKDIAGKSTAEYALTDTAKSQKQIILNRIAGQGVENPSPNWRPKWASFPSQSYRGKGSVFDTWDWVGAIAKERDAKIASVQKVKSKLKLTPEQKSKKSKQVA